MIFSARTTFAPKAAPMAWCPRHTPRIGSLPAKYFTNSMLTPAFCGVHGPGEITMWRAFRASIPVIETLSVRPTPTLSPHFPKDRPRFYGKETYFSRTKTITWAHGQIFLV